VLSVRCVDRACNEVRLANNKFPGRVTGNSTALNSAPLCAGLRTGTVSEVRRVRHASKTNAYYSIRV
jgi:hypothetical protein